MIRDPVTLTSEKTIGNALDIMKKYSISGIPVVDSLGKLVGILTNRDLRFDPNRNLKVKDLMTSKNLVSAPVGTDLKRAETILQKHKIEKLPVVDKDGILKGLSLAVITLTVPVVAQTLQRWFGYVPGFGLVGSENLRTLAEPVSITAEGFTLTVEKVLSSSEKTVITYTLEGLTPEMISEQNPCTDPGSDPNLVLPDGRELPIQGLGASSMGSVVEYKATFSGLPAQVDEFTLQLTCVTRTQPSSVPSNWQIPLRLGTGPQSELTPLPIIEVTSSEPSGVGPLAGLQVLQIVPFENGVILAGTLDVDPVEGFTIREESGFLDSMTVSDANGKCVPVMFTEDDFLASLSEDQKAGKIPWAAQLVGSDFVWPLTITVDSVRAVGPDYEPTTFQVDLGDHLQPGEKLALNLDVPLGPKTLHVISVERMLQPSEMAFINFAFTYDASVEISFQIEGYNPMGGGGGGDFSANAGGCIESDGSASEIIYIARGYRDDIPSGKVTIDLTGNPVIQIPGPWQVVIDKPVGP